MRGFQGMGGALMVPVGRLAVLRTTPKHQLITAIATLTWPALVAPIIGPPLGGFITSYADWRWIFFINVRSEERRVGKERRSRCRPQTEPDAEPPARVTRGR